MTTYPLHAFGYAKRNIILIPILISTMGWSQNNAIFSGGNGDGFSLATLGTLGGEVPLPIELEYFTGNVKNDGVELLWKTVSERNSDHFSIERSFDANNFQVVQHVKAAGTSSIAKVYQYFVGNPPNGLTYYRLKQTDIDNQSTFSKIIAVDYNSPYRDLFSVYPNPANGSKVTISMNVLTEALTSLRLAIMNEQGEQCVSATIKPNTAGAPVYDLSIAHIPNGIYFLKIHGCVKRLIVSR